MSFQLDERINYCYYCITYNEVISEYPINHALDQSLVFSKETPRCELHFRFTCSFCNRDSHFNGIAWCNTCNKFSCSDCSQTSVIELEFLIYEYYYEIKCSECNLKNPCLDAAEFLLQHPYQIGAIKPKTNLYLWVPMGSNYSTRPSNRFENYSNLNIIKLEENVDEVNTWNELAKTWSEAILHDINHKYIIYPYLFSKLKSIEKKTILDLGCGPGAITTKLHAKKIIGVDPSDMIDLAIKNEADNPKGIIYHKKYLKNIAKDYPREFDIVISNMMLMDVSEVESLLIDVKSTMKLGAKLMITILHPAFNSPALQSFRVPSDSKRIEDKFKISNNYIDEAVYRLEFKDKSYTIVHHRPISFYINTLIKLGFQITDFQELVPSQEGVENHPTNYRNDEEYNPMFLFIECTI